MMEVLVNPTLIANDYKHQKIKSPAPVPLSQEHNKYCIFTFKISINQLAHTSTGIKSNDIHISLKYTLNGKILHQYYD